MEKAENDKLLVKQVIDGNERAFRKLFDTYSGDIYRYSLSLLKSKVYAEEIVQDVFIKVWSKRENLDASLSIKSYLFTITRNKCFNFLKKAANEFKLCEEVFFRSQESYIYTDMKIIEDDMENIKRQAIDLLPPKRRLIFEMSRNDGKSYYDIGQELGISINTVKSQMNKALATIRDFLMNHKDITFTIILLISGWLE